MEDFDSTLELINHLKEQRDWIVGICGTLLVSLVSAIGVLWYALNKERNYSRTQDLENLKVITKLTNVLDSLSDGIKITLPKQIDDLKSDLTERISNLKEHIK